MSHRLIVALSPYVGATEPCGPFPVIGQKKSTEEELTRLDSHDTD